MRILAAVAAALGTSCVLALCIPLGPAHAQAADEQGWWSETNLSVPGMDASLPAQPPAPPDVPAQGLLVEGGPSASSPVAYAAVMYALAGGASATTLTLNVAPQSATTPNTTLEICPLTDPTFQAEQGGPMSDAPAYTCAKNATAQPSTSGTVYKFSVTHLVQGGTLAVAILPTSPADRVVLSQPDSSSLAVQGGDSSSEGTGPLGGTTSTPSATTPSGSASLSGPVAGAAATPAGSQAAQTTGPEVATPAGGSTDVPPASASGASPALARPGSQPAAPVGPQAPSELPAATLGFASSPANPLVIALAITLALVGGAAWTGAGRAAVRAAARINDTRSSRV